MIACHFVRGCVRTSLFFFLSLSLFFTSASCYPWPHVSTLRRSCRRTNDTRAWWKISSKICQSVRLKKIRRKVEEYSMNVHHLRSVPHPLKRHPVRVRDKCTSQEMHLSLCNPRLTSFLGRCRQTSAKNNVFCLIVYTSHCCNKCRTMRAFIEKKKFFSRSLI